MKKQHISVLLCIAVWLVLAVGTESQALYRRNGAVSTRGYGVSKDFPEKLTVIVQQLYHVIGSELKNNLEKLVRDKGKPGRRGWQGLSNLTDKQKMLVLQALKDLPKDWAEKFIRDE